jgi:hypothetical protein
MSKHIDFSKPLSEEDSEYVRQREWMIQDATLSGFTVQLAGEEPVEPEPGQTSVGDDGAAGDGDGEPELTYDDLTVKQLQEEIALRNEDRDEDSQLSDKGKKDELIETLVADDEANPE